jgi:hypothetical protein
MLSKGKHLVTIGHTYRVRTQGSLMGQRVEWGVHMRHVGPGGDLTDFINSWAATIGPLLLACTSTATNWDRVTVVDVAEDGDESVTFGFTQPNPGQVTGECLPPQNSMLLSFKTGQKGRRKHGRAYIPGVSEANTSNGLLTGSQLTALQALGAGLTNAYKAGGTEPQYQLVVYSPEELDPPPPKPFKPRPGILNTFITAAIGSDVVRTQRHRAFGVGR